MHTDFSQITPCGGNCSHCEHFLNSKCEGCLKNNGQCVHMWKNGCDIFKCCEKHELKFCGLCNEFPCELIKNTITTWNKDGIETLKKLAAEYNNLNKI